MLLAADSARALDPSLIMTEAGLAPDPWQRKALLSDSKDVLMLCSRQSGKSTVAAARALHVALYQPESLTLLVSRSERQSGNLFHAVKTLYRKLSNVPRVRETATMLEIQGTGSRILALPGSEETVRGLSGVDLVIIDEASRVDEGMLVAVEPMLSTTDGPLWCLSTPFGRRGWFFDRWTDDPAVERVMVTADQCPRISREWLERQRKRMQPWQFEQEFYCKFTDTAEQVFGSMLLDGAMTNTVAAIW